MNYQKHYDALVERARNRVIDGYVERHHIVPRCMGGTDDQSNIVPLTPEEHYVAHQLLVKLHPENYKLMMAAFILGSERQSNKVYGWIRRNNAIAQSVTQRVVQNQPQTVAKKSVSMKRSFLNEDVQRRHKEGVVLAMARPEVKANLARQRLEAFIERVGQETFSIIEQAAAYGKGSNYGWGKTGKLFSVEGYLIKGYVERFQL